jgi:excisionase family DNA binding protein
MSDISTNLKLTKQSSLLSGEDVATYLNVSKSYAYLLMRKRQIPFVHFGRTVRVRPEDLLLFIQKNLVVDNEELVSPQTQATRAVSKEKEKGLIGGA